MITSLKLLTVFVLIQSVCVTTLSIHKSRRVLRRPLKVLEAPEIDENPSENKYLSLTALFDVTQDEPVVTEIAAENEKPKAEVKQINDDDQNDDDKNYETNIRSDTQSTFSAKWVEDGSPAQEYEQPTKDLDETENDDTNVYYDNYHDDKQITFSTKRTEHKNVYDVERDEQTPTESIKQKEMNPSYKNSRSDTQTFPRRTKDPVVPIIENQNYVYAHNGDYHYSYEGGDGTRAFERGGLKTAEDVGDDVVVGGYSYKDNEGNDYSVTYTAGENGYRPVGAHLPTPPPIPPAIQRVLRILATKTTPEPVTESLSNYYDN